MIANFHIHYKTAWGGQVAIRLRRDGAEEIVALRTYDGENWHIALPMTEKGQIAYKYIVRTGSDESLEFGSYRSLTMPKEVSQVFVRDFWRPTDVPEQAFFSAAFKDVIFKRNKLLVNRRPQRKKAKGNKIVFQLNAAAIPQNMVFCVLGNCDVLGNWEKPVLLSGEKYPLWQAETEWSMEEVDVEYKFAIYDPTEKKVVRWEAGENRKLHFHFPSPDGHALVQTDEQFHYPPAPWHGAGVAIPVFSLRSKNGLGIGEFTDLKPLVDWAVKTNLKLVQVLPVNDTIVTKTWKDSYPYRAISVFALHPLYINVNSIAKLKNKSAAARLRKKTTELNKLEAIDFEQVMKTKFEFFHLLFKQEKAAFLKNKKAKAFMEKNADWLKPYAVFCHLRDVYKTADFSKWEKHAAYSPQAAEDFCNPKSKAFDEILFYQFLQFHAHEQLSAATDYARQNGVVLKGDLPIGIARSSCDAWVAPHLYNMDGQAGAPPDFYAENGQNWGFPTYNWEEMSKDNFQWWRQRMTKLAEYFDALRIDHILGFFRIWQIPTDQVIGTMGLFNPRLPYGREELAGFGLHGNLDRYVKPYIRGHFLGEMFGEDADFVQDNFLNEVAFGVFELKDFISNQLKVKQLFENVTPICNRGNLSGSDYKSELREKLQHKKHLLPNLMRLVSEVLLLEEPGSNGSAYNPRITLTSTRSFQELSDHEQQVFEKIYNEYHFNRHNEFWREQALWKLPPLLQATNMLICGEDLGMIPDSVAGVMQQLNILTLEIQRMSKNDQVEFGEPEKYPYASVCSPSCHDMPTVRGWWEEDFERSQRFLQKQLTADGTAPATCTPGIVEAINWQHLESPSMWAIFPLQDLVGMNAQLRRPDATAEQINNPSNPEHYWRFRFHLPMGELLEAEELNEKIKGMVRVSGRG